MAKCVACRLGLFHECRAERKCDDADSSSISSNSDSSDSSIVVGVASGNSQDPIANHGGGDDSEGIDELGDSDPAEKFRTYKDDSALKDQQSTGRKRAAKMYPLDLLAECEWKMKKNCGGGEHPITGCTDGKQEARHHGPEKNTLNNDKGNVHRICHTCHNRWHTLNDEDYVWSAVQKPHQPQEATILDMYESETFWQGRRVVKAKD